MEKSKGFALPVVFVVMLIGATAGSIFLLNQNKSADNQQAIVTNETSQTSENTKPPATTNLETTSQNLETNAKKEEKPQEAPQKKPTKNENITQQKQEPKNIVYSDTPKTGSFIYIDNELQVTASKIEGGIRLNWSRCNSDQFVSYKVARSNSATDVFYPRDGAIASIANQDTLSYIDKNVEAGKTYYYRICSLEKNGESWCGNVVSVGY
ncbi:MAG: hypothetical protein NZM26_00815 [Patescibacteria group bacterium]|nr:hypothetical protein [Patescibacteria group bacterium]